MRDDDRDPRAGPPSTPANPEAYDSPRNSLARSKGLDAPYIAGGDDPDPTVSRAEERRYWRLLVAMVLVIVSSGFVIGTLIALASATGGR